MFRNNCQSGSASVLRRVSMVGSLIDSDRSDSVKKRVYLPDVDEFRSSSGPLSEVVLESLDAVSCHRAKPLKEGYVADLTREAGVSPCSVILGLLYIHRLTESNPRYLRSMSGKDLFLTAMMIASKYLNDEGESEALTNSEWAEVGCKLKPTLDLMERQFLAAIDWRLYVSLEEYYSFVTGIEGRIALNQFAARGWLTYTDLVTIWDAMDTQRALLTATKHVAKVTCGSAAVYLVLLSTLLTASHALHSTWSPSTPLTPSPSTNASTCSQLQDAAATTPIKEPELGLDPALESYMYNPTHSEYLHDRFIKRLLHLKPHTGHFMASGIAVKRSPTAYPDVNMTIIHKESHKKEALRVKTKHFSREEGLHSLKYCSIMDSQFSRTIKFSETWLGSMDLRGTMRRWSVLDRGTQSVENFEHDWNQFHRAETHGDGVKVSWSDNKWINYFYSCIETLGKWFPNGPCTLLDFTKVLNPSHTNNSSAHTLNRMHAFGLDAFPMLLAGDNADQGPVPMLVKSSHQKFLPFITTT